MSLNQKQVPEGPAVLRVYPGEGDAVPDEIESGLPDPNHPAFGLEWAVICLEADAERLVFRKTLGQDQTGATLAQVAGPAHLGPGSGLGCAHEGQDDGVAGQSVVYRRCRHTAFPLETGCPRCVPYLAETMETTSQKDSTDMIPTVSTAFASQ
jgi:hypothetical protein